jgi:protein-S-isoprenylcysteine O-methyltransferase Ste14
MLTAGLILYAACLKVLGEYFSEVTKIVPDHKLITNGPYGLIRHPIYLSEIIFSFSIPMILDSLYGLLLPLISIPLLLYRIRFEERALVSRFGKEYLEYSCRTKKLIPYIY